jgi:hypothetical protein
VKALPEWLGQCTLLEDLCVRARRRRRERVRLCRSEWGCCGRPPERWAAVRGRARRCGAAVWRGLPSRAVQWRVCTGADRVYARYGWAETARRGRTVARRYASGTELAALPAAVEWPNLKSL